MTSPPRPTSAAPPAGAGTTAAGTGTPTGTPSSTPSPAPSGTGQVPALQTALAAEHAVIWGYGIVGARAGDPLQAAVRDADDAHRTRRDQTVTLITTYGGDPVPTESSYALPFPVTDRRSALRLAVHLEEGAAAAWRYTVAATDDVDVRRTALLALADAAVRATRWRVALPIAPATVPFPGD
ncbi:MAG TPA: ferritin-like domain-containing protein [Mycobacteriales bacterium]|nr:ferritin-like domain-containing protein [Mycobacteriales bacterium]